MPVLEVAPTIPDRRLAFAMSRTDDHHWEVTRVERADHRQQVESR